MSDNLHKAVKANMNLPVFAIDLDSRGDRWRDLSANANSINLEVQRVQAVNGKQIDPSDWEKFDAVSARRRNGREILPGEYGCYRSHVLALEAFLADGSQYGLIIEDDVAFNESALPRIEAIIAAVPDFDLIKLINHRSRLFVRAVKTSLGDEIGRTMLGPQGSTAAYLVTRDGARKMISQLAVMSLPWDVAVERFWDTNLKVYSSRWDVIGFGAGRHVSSIVGPSGSYKAGNFPWWKRFNTAAFRTKDHLLRLHNVLLTPAGYGTSNHAAAEMEKSPLKEAMATIAILALISAVWKESDAYRYAGLLFVLFAFVRWLRADSWTYGKPLIGWVGFLCLGWAIYVFDRLMFVYFTTGQLGSSEGIYLFPALYTTTAYGFLVYVRRPTVVVLWFMILSLVLLAVGTDYAQIAQGVRLEPGLFNNTIHAAVCAGMIFLCTLQFASYTGQRSDLTGTAKILHWALAAAVLLFTSVNIVVLRSKGVWFALAVALALLAVMSLVRGTSRRGLMAGAVILALVLVAIAISHDILFSTAGSTATFMVDFASDVARRGWNAAIGQALTGDSVPTTVQERLMLWVDALDVWARHPIFGAGSSWLTEWQHRTYRVQIYDVFHNGYLEVAARYGVVGLAFYGFLFAWAARQVLQASRAGLVVRPAWQCYISTLVFFSLTILTNSNNRLAIGESYMWFAAAFGFYCFYLRQRAGLIAPRTYF